MLVSIVIPAFNEASTIAMALKSALAFASDGWEHEIIVVDGKSTDGTRDILDNMTRANPQIVILDNEERKTPVALNIAIRRAKGQIILRLDAHSEYPPDYLARCVEGLKNGRADNIGGVSIPQWKGRSVSARIVTALTSHAFGVGNSSFRTDMIAGPVDTVPYGCFRRSVFDEIGLFDERLDRNQDYEFNRRMIAAGKTIWLDPEIQVLYRNKDSVRSLLHQGITTAQWNPWMWFVAPYSFALRHAMPGIVVGGGAALVVLSFVSNIALIILGALGSIYLAIAALASFHQARKLGWWIGLVLPPLFFLYHVFYGSGVIYGIIRLLLRNAPVQKVREPWPGAGEFRAWPRKNKQMGNQQ